MVTSAEIEHRIEAEKSEVRDLDSQIEESAAKLAAALLNGSKKAREKLEQQHDDLLRRRERSKALLPHLDDLLTQQLIEEKISRFRDLLQARNEALDKRRAINKQIVPLREKIKPLERDYQDADREYMNLQRNIADVERELKRQGVSQERVASIMSEFEDRGQESA